MKTGARTFELEVGLPFWAMILYFVFRDRVSSLVLVLLVIVMARSSCLCPTCAVRRLRGIFGG